MGWLALGSLWKHPAYPIMKCCPLRGPSPSQEGSWGHVAQGAQPGLAGRHCVARGSGAMDNTTGNQRSVGQDLRTVTRLDTVKSTIVPSHTFPFPPSLLHSHAPAGLGRWRRGVLETITAVAHSACPVKGPGPLTVVLPSNNKSYFHKQSAFSRVGMLHTYHKCTGRLAENPARTQRL